jgi:methylmalonyl-CoA mutase N-terminal domain/subunit
MTSELKTASGIPLRPVYGPDDVPPAQRAAATTSPGERPYLRGAYPGMYRTKPWRIFQLSGFGNPEDENERIRFLLEHGETGFIMEHDRMTADHLYDVDHPEVLARKEDVGLTGAVILSARDCEIALTGIDQSRYYAHAGGGVVQHGPFANAAYWTVARRRGVDLARLAGTGQSDFFLTYLGCPPKQQVPARAGLRLNCDLIEFCTRELPRWVPVSIAAYNAADSGLNAWEELGVLLANAVEYLDWVKERGRLPLAEIARGVGGVSFRTSMELFEDVAKLRAARKMWHDLLTERYGVTDEAALRLRIHVVTAGSAMTYAQPLNNLVRGTLMALVAVLGGVQSLGVSGYDEAISIPSEHAHQMSVRIQQILQNETNLTAVADPLGGSHYVESLTAELESRAWGFFEEIRREGGFVAALDSGWLYRRAERNVLEDSAAIDAGRKKIVGTNCYEQDVGSIPCEGFTGSHDAWARATERLQGLRRSRDQRRALEAMKNLERVCRSEENVLPAMMEAMDADVSLGEVGSVFRESFGDWKSPIAI